MRIAIFPESFPCESFLMNKILGFARRGLDVDVYASSGRDSDRYRELIGNLPANLKLHYLPAGWRVCWWGKLVRLPFMLCLALLRHPRQTLRLLAHLCRRYGLGRELGNRLFKLLPLVRMKADIIHFEWDLTGAAYVDLFHLVKCPTVVSCRGAGVHFSPLVKPWLEQQYAEMFDNVTRVHCVAFQMVESARGYGLCPEKAFVNYPSIDHHFFAPSNEQTRREDRFVIVSVGRLHWKKGYNYALSAIRLLVNRSLRIRYIIVGDGGWRSQIFFDIWDIGLSGSVELTGAQNRESVRNYLASSDVFLLPSVEEGLSNSALEAMAMELPVVVTDVGGMREAVRDGIEGFVVPPRDYKAMADRLEQLMLDPELRRRMGQNGRKRVVEHFGIEQQLDKFIECYEELVAESKRKREQQTKRQ